MVKNPFRHDGPTWGARGADGGHGPDPDQGPQPSSGQVPRSVPALAAGFLLVAGVLHLFLVDDHLAHARGAGLFFLAIGMGQVLWSLLYLNDPDVRLGRVGLAVFVIAPTLLYLVTRVLRAPWSTGPEDVDVIGLVTQAAQIGGGVALYVQWRPTLPTREASTVVAIGLVLALGSYGGAMASEDIDWLATPEAAHVHGPGEDLHGADDGHAHGDVGEGGHEGHLSTDFVGTRGESIVGEVAHYGPTTGAGINELCNKVGHPNEDCWIAHLTSLLNAEGSIPAFAALADLIDVNHNAEAEGHALAHVLGHHAYQAYGLDISLTLGECSYEVFQGCIHGALQAHFADLAAQGEEIDGEVVSNLCSAAETSFEAYTCNHGVGHGIMMYTNYAMTDSLDMCSEMSDWAAQQSCYGGVFMENAVAYLDSLDPDWEPHAHSDEPPTFWVDEDDPAYPCTVVDDEYKPNCWRMQTSLILRWNGGDFEAASRICDEAEPTSIPCYQSLGRDAPPYALRDPAKMERFCSYGDQAEERHACIEAMSSGMVLKANHPQPGLDTCIQLSEPTHQDICYREVGQQGASIVGLDEMTTLCDAIEDEGHRALCHEGAEA